MTIKLYSDDVVDEAGGSEVAIFGASRKKPDEVDDQSDMVSEESLDVLDPKTTVKEVFGGSRIIDRVVQKGEDGASLVITWVEYTWYIITETVDMISGRILNRKVKTRTEVKELVGTEGRSTEAMKKEAEEESDKEVENGDY